MFNQQEEEKHIQPASESAGAEPPRRVGMISSRLLVPVILISLLFGGLGGLAGSAYLFRLPEAQNIAGQSQVNQKINLTEESAVIDVVKNASPAVVSIVISKDLNKVPGFGFNPFDFDPFAPFFGEGEQQNTPDVQQVGAGSGFFISSDGLILTNKHVVADEQASYTVVTTDGKSYEAKVLSRDPVNDLALIKIDISNASKLNLADSERLQIGQRVIAIGYSLGQYENTVTTGVVSGIGRSVTAGSTEGTEQLSGVIQTDAAINPGNSGGPLLNIAGQVVGINTAIDRQGQLVGFAIPANDAARALDSFEKYGRITRPFVGVRYIMITPALAKSEQLPREYGALILRGENAADLAVIPSSPADKAGLKEDDIILEVGGTKLDSKNTLSGVLKNYQVGETVDFKVLRGGEELVLRVALGEAK